MADSVAWMRDLTRKRVLIVGDVMIDRYLYGEVTRISPEAPVPVVQFTHRVARLGGAANVALNVGEMGAKAILAAVVGQDEDGTAYQQLMQQSGLDDLRIVSCKDRRTTVKTRIIAGNQHLLRVDSEDTHPIDADSFARLHAHLREVLQTGQADVVIMQDYNKGLLTAEMIREVVSLARQANTPIAVDPKFQHFSSYRGVTLFKPNLKELQEGLGRLVRPERDDLTAAVQELHRKLDHQYSLITLSERGVFWFDHNNKAGGLIPATPRSIVDVCGAGDTVIALAALALAAGRSMAEVALVANLAGGQVCEQVGVVPVDAGRLRDEVLTLTA